MSIGYDLHRHLEGSHSPRALLSVAIAHDIGAFKEPSTGEFLSPEKVRERSSLSNSSAWERFDSCVKFSRLAYVSTEAIRDLTRFTCVEAVREAGHVEFRFSPLSMVRVYLTNRGIMPETVDDKTFARVHGAAVLEAMLEGRKAAQEETKTRILLRYGFSRTNEMPSKLAALADVAMSYAKEFDGLDILGTGGVGREETLAEEIVTAMQTLRRKVGDLTVHAGEMAGPESVRKMLELGPEAFGHGVRAAEDPQLVKELAARGTVLEVCPTSNRLLIDGAIQRIRKSCGKYPLAHLLDAGVRCVVCTDDPAIFGSNLEHELQAAELQGADLSKVLDNAQTRWNQLVA